MIPFLSKRRAQLRRIGAEGRVNVLAAKLDAHAKIHPRHRELERHRRLAIGGLLLRRGNRRVHRATGGLREFGRFGVFLSGAEFKGHRRHRMRQTLHSVGRRQRR